MRHGLYKVDLENDVTVYEPNKGDGRIRAYIKSMKCVVSYPKLLMAVHLGRDLDDDEEVHHIDENPLNNDLSNLIVLPKSEHAKLHGEEKRIVFEDKAMICPMCGKEFIWTAHQQQNSYRNSLRASRKINPAMGPFCSAHCCGYYSRLVQDGKIQRYELAFMKNLMDN